VTGKPADASGGQHGIAPSAPVPTTFNPGVDYYRRNDIQGMNIPHYQHDIPAPFVDHSQFHHGAQPQQYPNVENCGKGSQVKIFYEKFIFRMIFCYKLGDGYDASLSRM
jgi:hypothetical protein